MDASTFTKIFGLLRFQTKNIRKVTLWPIECYRSSIVRLDDESAMRRIEVYIVAKILSEYRAQKVLGGAFQIVSTEILDYFFHIKSKSNSNIFSHHGTLI